MATQGLEPVTSTQELEYHRLSGNMQRGGRVVFLLFCFFVVVVLRAAGARLVQPVERHSPTEFPSLFLVFQGSFLG